MTNIMKLANKEVNFAVAHLEGIDVNEDCYGFDEHRNPCAEYSPSTEWIEAGPIIEQQKICIEYITETKMWRAHNGKVSVQFSTPLVAAMHCYVMDKLGREVDMEKIYEALQIEREWADEK